MCHKIENILLFLARTKRARGKKKAVLAFNKMIYNIRNLSSWELTQIQLRTKVVFAKKSWFLSFPVKDNLHVSTDKSAFLVKCAHNCLDGLVSQGDKEFKQLGRQKTCEILCKSSSLFTFFPPLLIKRANNSGIPRQYAWKWIVWKLETKIKASTKN